MVYFHSSLWINLHCVYTHIHRDTQSYTHMHQTPYFLYSSVREHLSSFHVLAVMDTASIKTNVPASQ